jgi:hypothetical protein
MTAAAQLQAVEKIAMRCEGGCYRGSVRYVAEGKTLIIMTFLLH